MAYTARMLGREAYGFVNFGTAVTAYAAILVGPGLLIWGARAVAQDRERAGEYLLTINVTQLTLAFAAYLILFCIASLYLNPNERKIALVAGLGVFPIAASVEWVAQGLEKFRWAGAAQITASLAALLGTLLFVKSPNDAYKMLLVTAGSQLLAVLFLFALLRRKVDLSRARFSLNGAVQMLRPAFPLGFSAAMITVLHYANHLFLQFYRDAAALGIFGASFRVMEMLTTVPGLISTVFLPRLARTFKADPVQGRIEMGWFVSLVMSLVCLPVAILLVEAPELVRLIFGAQFAASANLLRVMSFAVLFNFAAVVYITGLLALTRDKAYFWSILAGLLVSVGGGFVAVPLFGVWGATVTVAVIDFATWLATLPTFYHVIGCLFLGQWVRPLLSGFALTAWLLLSMRMGLSFWVRVPVGIMAYGALIMPGSSGLLQGRPDPATTS